MLVAWKAQDLCAEPMQHSHRMLCQAVMVAHLTVGKRLSRMPCFLTRFSYRGAGSGTGPAATKGRAVGAAAAFLTKHCAQLVSNSLQPPCGRFWDWTSGNNFQAAQSVLQPGSLESEANICACAFDATGTRLLTAEGDKTVKFWRQDESATPESHPVNFRPPRDMRRF